MSEIRGSPIAFAPGSWWERVLFSATGWRLFVSSMHELAQAPAGLRAEKRAKLQQSLGERLLRHLRVRLEIEGLEHVPRTPHILVALHEGIADVLCLSQLPLAMRFVSRSEIFEWPWIGPALRGLQHISIEPERGAESYRKLLATADAVLCAREHLVLFPQGAVLGIEAAFQPGAFRLAKTLSVPMLPVVLTGAHRIWEHPFSPRVRYGQRVGAVILPAVPVSELRRRTSEEVRLNLQRRMKAIALSGRLPRPRRYVPERDGFWDGFAFDIDRNFPRVFQAVEHHRAALTAAQCNQRRA